MHGYRDGGDIGARVKALPRSIRTDLREDEEGGTVTWANHTTRAPKHSRTSSKEFHLKST